MEDERAYRSVLDTVIALRDIVSKVMHVLSAVYIPSPDPAGLKFVKRGSLSAAGLSDESRLAMSSGSPNSPCADVTLAHTKAIATLRSMITIDNNKFRECASV